jgi:hypothetical protein
MTMLRAASSTRFLAAVLAAGQAIGQQPHP